MISFTNLAAMLAASLIAILGPMVLLVLWCVRKKTSPMPALTGALIFLVFVRILEMIPHTFFLLTDNPLSRAVTGNVWLYAIYGGLAAGIFEETGRFMAFRFFLKKYTKKETAVTYGIGHGGFEAISIAGFAFLQYFGIGLMINNGTMDSIMANSTGAALDSIQAAVTAVSSITASACAVSVLERIYTVIFHIALSVLVFRAVRTPGKKWLFPLAILLHALLDVFAGFYQTGTLPLAAVETIGVIFTVLVSFFAYRVYHEMKTEDLDYAA